MMLKNLIDLHAHILPKIDDGAKNLKKSIFLGEASIAEGISIVVATPHYYEEYSSGMLTLRMDRFAQVKKAFVENNIEIELLQGFEVSASRALLNRRSLLPLTLNGTRWILIERLYDDEGDFDEVLEAVFAAGLSPLIAHPERYDYFTHDISNLEKLIERGALAQITASSLAGYQGSITQEWCLKAIERELVHVVASDMHNLEHRPLLMKLSSEMVEQRFGSERAQKIFIDTPLRILGRKTG